MFERGATLRAAGGPLTGLGAQVLLLAVLAQTVGLGRAGWVVGAACALILDAALARALWCNPAARLGPAGWVTLTRATLAVGVAALTADSFERDVAVATLVALASLALALDFVDGWVARRTKTASALGASLDGEVDAFLILALSVEVAPSAGVWVLAIGAARYAFLAAGWPFGWMRAPLPRRDWRKVVAAAQGITLMIAAAEVVPPALTRAALAVALALLAESFGRDVWWLWRHRRAADPRIAAVRDRDSGGAVVLTLLALVVVWVALVAPNQPWLLTPGAFVKLPLEGIVVVMLAVVLPTGARRLIPWVIGPALGLLALVKLLDLGFFIAFDRPFNPVDDWSYASIGVETVRDTFGRTYAVLAVAGAVLLGVAALVLPTLAVLRLTRVAARHRRLSLRSVTALAATWVLCWAFGAELVSGAHIASMGTADLAVDEVRAVQSALHDRARFRSSIHDDRFSDTPGSRLLTGLRGKDVLLVFVESYGRLAVEGSSFSPGIDTVLDAGTRQLAAAGFSSRSGWLTSATFGGASWLAHATLQSGAWADSQGRYNELVASDRLTLSKAFGRAGWRTVGDVPSNNRSWPEGSSFYHYDKLYDRRNVGYRGPRYAYASMPDQYVLLALQRLELAKPHRRPLFAEVDLVSSHGPWTRVPPLIDWSRVGDGSIFNRLPVDQTGLSDVQHGYARSIRYTLRALFSFVERYGRKNLVLVVLGDHQPSRVVTGYRPSHDVPISVIAHDRAVMRRIAGWGWVDGMHPGPRAPVWRMSAFRNRFLSAFGS
ncbi:MAG: CDP-alcohol phosphatidyltransferase family protein [Gaiellaceae bacterium]